MSATITKEGIEVMPGQIWRDLDKRMGNRRVVVRAVYAADGKAEVQNIATGGHTKLSIKRMYRHSTGWALVGIE